MEDSLVKKKSYLSVQETMKKLESAIKEMGIRIFGKIDHGKNAQQAGLQMNESQVIIFGSPKAGTVLMRQNIFLSVDLPLRIAVVKDSAGEVWMVYNSISALKMKHNLSESDILEKVGKLLDEITSLAVE